MLFIEIWDDRNEVVSIAEFSPQSRLFATVSEYGNKIILLYLIMIIYILLLMYFPIIILIPITSITTFVEANSGC